MAFGAKGIFEAFGSRLSVPVLSCLTRYQTHEFRGNIQYDSHQRVLGCTRDRLRRAKKKNPADAVSRGFPGNAGYYWKLTGAGCRTRTRHLMITSQALYLMS